MMCSLTKRGDDERGASAGGERGDPGLRYWQSRAAQRRHKRARLHLSQPMVQVSQFNGHKNEPLSQRRLKDKDNQAKGNGRSSAAGRASSAQRASRYTPSSG
ncbi:hypothetical protein NL676_014343 [Syzygium grande]|nr:hypothetical protein NL676_014343 [Syzygium grande]